MKHFNVGATNVVKVGDFKFLFFIIMQEHNIYNYIRIYKKRKREYIDNFNKININFYSDGNATLCPYFIFSIQF